MEEVAPASESNGEDLEPKQETAQEENDCGSRQTFSYDQLKAKSDNPVKGIDFKKREVGSIMNVRCLVPMKFRINVFLLFFRNFQAYLSDEEFQTVFGVTKEAFYKLPKWKQDMQKKKVDLF